MSQRPIPRRQFLKVVGSSALAGSALANLRSPRTARAATTATAPQRPRNILMMVADDQRSDTIAALGNKIISTPNLDRLVQQGFAFTHARCMGAQQGAVCVPSRACLMTGRTLFHVPDDCHGFPLLPETFRHQGFATFGCGKWHNGTASYTRAFSTGGNIFFGGMHNQYRTPVFNFDPAGRYPAAQAHVPGKFSSTLFADSAVEFLHRQPADQPFFAYVAFTSPHDPRTPPAPYSTMYDPAKMPLPVNFLPNHPFDNGDLHVRDEKLAPFPRTAEDTRRQLCDYYGMVSSQDAEVGRVLQALAQSGHADDTLVIYTGDHGLAIGSHGLFGKQNVYEHSAGIPMILSGPGITPGQSAALVYGFDLFPTICDIMGVKAPATVEGLSLQPLLSGRQTAVRDSAFHTYIKEGAKGGVQQAVTDGRWKYHHYQVQGTTTTLLFDLQSDPGETHNLLTDPAAAPELPRLQALLQRWITQVNA